MNSFSFVFVKVEARQLFDIACCKCKSRRACKCPVVNKPQAEPFLFLADQRKTRKKVLQILETSTRSVDSTNYELPSVSDTFTARREPIFFNEDSNDSEITLTATDSVDSPTDDQFLSSPVASASGLSLRSHFIEDESEYASRSRYNTVKPYELTKVAERYRVPDRVAAALGSAALVDHKLVGPNNTVNIIDKSKIRRCRKEIRNMHANNMSFDGMSALYFDGRGDTALVYENRRVDTAKEEHISFVQMPNSVAQYLLRNIQGCPLRATQKTQNWTN